VDFEAQSEKPKVMPQRMTFGTPISAVEKGASEFSMPASAKSIKPEV